MSLFDDEITWEEPPKMKGGPGRTGYISQWVERVKERPNTWAVLRTGSKNPLTMEKKRYPGMQWTSRRVDDGTYSIYGRWVGIDPDEDEDEDGEELDEEGQGTPEGQEAQPVTAA